MFFLLNSLTLQRMVITILAARVYVTSGLTCYNCHYADDDLSNLLNLTNVPHSQKCSLSAQYLNGAPTEACKPSEPTCGMSVVSVSVVSSVSTVNWPFYKEYSNTRILKCTSVPTPKEEENCASLSENYARWIQFSELPINSLYQEDNVTREISTFEGDTCLCATNLCNGHLMAEKVEINENEPEIVTNKGQTNYIKNSFPVGVIALCWISLHSFKHC